AALADRATHPSQVGPCRRGRSRCRDGPEHRQRDVHSLLARHRPRLRHRLGRPGAGRSDGGAPTFTSGRCAGDDVIQTPTATATSVTPPREVRLMGVRGHLMTIPQMHELIGDAVERGERLVIVSQNLHSVYLAHRTPDLMEVQERASYVRIDGLPVIWFARFLGYPAGERHRTGWNEWLDPFMNEA